MMNSKLTTDLNTKQYQFYSTYVEIEYGMHLSILLLSNAHTSDLFRVDL
jgi:hypothetical protein